MEPDVGQRDVLSLSFVYNIALYSPEGLFQAAEGGKQSPGFGYSLDEHAANSAC